MPPILQALLAFLLALVVIVGPILFLKRRLDIRKDPEPNLRAPQKLGQAILAAEKLCEDLTIRLDGLERITACLGHGVFVLRIGQQEVLVSKDYAEDRIREHFLDDAAEAQAFTTLRQMAARVAPHARKDFSNRIERH